MHISAAYLSPGANHFLDGITATQFLIVDLISNNWIKNKWP